MAQASWLYLSDNGGRHKVGLYHGDHSGHVLIYCNSKIVRIDFSVYETKYYTFFIEDDLIEVRLIKEHGLFYYQFYINKEANTPKNNERKIEMKKNAFRTVMFFLTGLVLIGGTFFAVKKYNQIQASARDKVKTITIHGQPPKQVLQQLLTNGKKANAKVYFKNNNNIRQAEYAFMVSEKNIVTGRILLPDTNVVLLPTGFELQDRDEFEVFYLPEKPEQHYLRFDLPTTQQQQIYYRIAVGSEQLAHPKASPSKCACIVAAAQQVYGWKVLPNFIHQQRTSADYRAYNQDTYLRTIRDVEVDKKIKELCWNQ